MVKNNVHDMEQGKSQPMPPTKVGSKAFLPTDLEGINKTLTENAIRNVIECRELLIIVYDEPVKAEK